MNSNEYIEVSITLEPFSEEMAEIAEAELSDLPYDSFMIEEPFLKAYIQKDLYDQQALKVVLSGLDVMASFQASLMPSQNWNAEWESQFTPIVVDNKVTVKALHHTGLKKTRFNITINPQMAFGTGHHHTTYMMMETMLEIEDKIRGGIVMDMGCGTAVLGILAAKMRAQHVYGIDIDAVAAQSAYDNARLNRLGRVVETYYGDASLLQMGKYDVLLANIHRNVILMDLRTYSRSLRLGGIILLSGFYDSDVPTIREEAENEGLVLIGQKSREGWSCLQFEKK